MASQAATYRFGPYELRTSSRQLSKQGTRLRLRPQSYHVLQLLTSRAGDAVPREELQKLLWPGETVVDFELGLNTCIKELRGVLNDSASEPRYIETLPKLGYRLIATVEVEGDTENTAVANEKEKWPAVERRKRAWPPRAWWKAWMWAAMAVLAVAAIGLGVKWMRGHEAARNTAAAANGRVMLAVLPFENLTGGSAQDYFSDGLTEEMIAQLGRLDAQHVGVIARTSVMHYKNSREQLDQIGRELAVQYVLEGSVRREANKVRISAQLIQMKDQSHVWANQYDREMSNLLVLQGEIAQEIAGEIQNALGAPKQSNSPRETPLSPAELEAHDLYLKGLYFWNKRTVAGFEQAINYYQQAIGKDPKNARAYAGLADCYSLIGGYSAIQKPEYAEKARAAARKALEMDDSLPEAHTAWALIIQNYDWQWKEAEREYRRAIELNPNYATAHHWYAEHLSWRGRFDEALQESELARQLDPLSLIIAADHGVILYFARRYDQAIKQFQSVMDLDPNYPRTGIIREAYAQKGVYTDALGLLEKETPKGEFAAYYWGEVAYTYGRAGRYAEAQHALEKVLEESNRQPQMAVEGLAKAYIGVGNKDEALKWLEWAAAHQPNALTTLKVDPVYDPLRSEPRFQELLHRVGLTP